MTQNTEQQDRERLEKLGQVAGKKLADNPQLLQNLEAYKQADHGQAFDDFELFEGEHP